MMGKLYGIGVGPGDPELLTVKAIKAIKELDVIIAPKTEKKDGSVALNIAREYLKEDAHIEYLVFPMTVGFAKSDASWQANKDVIMSFLAQGKNVGFLTIGDPMFFSTYIYVFRLLQQEDVEITTIPGIPAYCAIASATNTPIIEGDCVLSIIPANIAPERIRAALQHCDNAVLMKVYKDYPEVVDILQEEKMAEQAILVSRCGLDDELIIKDITQDKNRKLNYLSTIITRKDS